MEYNICVLIVSAFWSEIFLIIIRIQGDVVINVHRPLCKVSLILVRF
jgi:hypothetical protein